MTFEIRWTESSFKKLEKLDLQIQERIVRKLVEASADPFVMAKKLSGVNLYTSWRLSCHSEHRAKKTCGFSYSWAIVAR